MIISGIWKIAVSFQNTERRYDPMKLITLYLPEPYIRALDSLVTARFYPNRAEAIRVAIKDLISTEVWERRPNGD